MRGRRIRFGALVFEPSTGILRRNGARCELQAQPARLLALLLERAGETVTRDDIRQQLWPDVVVEYDQNINFAVRQIRLALGGEAGSLQTVPRRGYRFVGEVTVDADGAPGLSKWVALAAALVAALASGFSAGILVRDAPAGRFVHDHLVHPDRCPYLRAFVSIQRAL
jgi:DNA-binding winged helix-turn-helix (wHTH) protein